MQHDLYSLIAVSAARSPDALALVTPDGQEVSYSKLMAVVESFTWQAHSRGLCQGNVVLVRVDNYAVQLLLTISLSRLGVTCIFGCALAEVERFGLAVDAMIALEADVSASGQTATQYIPFSQDWFAPSPSVGTQWPGYPHENSIAMVVTSSGTTGKKKLMPMTMAMVRNRLPLFDPLYGTGFASKMISIGVHTQYGFMLMLRALSQGAAVMQLQDSPHKTLTMMNRYQVNELCTTPGVVVDLIHAQQQDFLALASLKQVVIAGSAVSHNLLGNAGKYLCDAILLSYGSTETGIVSVGKLDELLTSPPGAVGSVRIGAEVVILDDAGQALPLGHEGGIGIRLQPGVGIESYISSDVAASSSLQGGWFHPGDMGYVSETGQLVITGRASDLINMGGDKVSPENFEATVAKIRGVLQVGAVGIRNSHGFDDVCLVVVCEDYVQRDDLMVEIKRLLGEMTPFRLRIEGALPVNAGGKTDRECLRNLFAVTQEG